MQSCQETTTMMRFSALRFVISDTDPGVANWLDTANTREAFVFLRWQGLPAPLVAEDAPRIEVVPLSELRAHLPAGTRWLNATERASHRIPSPYFDRRIRWSCFGWRSSRDRRPVIRPLRRMWG